MINRELIAKLGQQLKADGVSALMVAPSPDMMFLVGNSPYLCERFQALFVKDDGTLFYVCNALSVDETTEFMEGARIYGWPDGANFGLTVKQAFEDHGLVGKKIAINSGVRAFNLIQIMECVDFTPVNGKSYLEQTRIIKTPEELENLRKSALLIDKVFEEVIKLIRPGMTERDVKNEIARICKELGGKDCSGGIVAINANAAMPHYSGDSAVIGEHAVVVMDMGCTVGGMNSDTTRTVFVGKATEREKYLYNLVLQANLAGEEAAVNGAYIPDVDAAARKVIEAAGFGKEFNHRLGHGIGYAGHEAPYIQAGNDLYLAPGMAFSCEPGIYIKDEIGIRIEDVVIINEHGEREVLNKSSKELIEIL